ncbi:MAG: type II toxin-antitoxin system RelE/ParE family toxin [Dehalococcoidia bacterium]
MGADSGRAGVLTPRVAHSVSLARQADRELRALPARVVRRIRPAIDSLAETPRPRGTVKLGDDSYRIRVGTYRIIYDVDDRAKEVIILHVRHRKDAYRRR